MVKQHITLNQLRYMLFESKSNIKDFGNVLRMGICDKQKELSFGYPGYVFVHKDTNPNFDKNKPYILIVHEIDPETHEDYGWQLHYRGIETVEFPKETLDDLYIAIAKSLPKGFNLEATGGITPGGLSGIERLKDYGFKKEYHPQTSAHWTSTKEQGGILDVNLLNHWLNSGKHDDEFIVIQGDKEISPKDFDGEFTINNTKPRSFSMLKL